MSPLVVALTLAFSAPETFNRPAETGGGGGRLFTGSPTSKWDCSVCHDNDPTLTAELESDPPGLLTKGYEPGKTYRLIITLGVAANGAFGMEAAGRNASAAGQFSNLPLADLAPTEKCVIGTTELDPVVVRTGGTAAQSGTCNTGTRSWRVDWTAPATDVGGLTFYLSAVAGNSNSANTGDREVSRVIGVPSPGTVSQRSSGCGAPAAALLLPFVGLLLVRRRRSAVLLVVLVSSVTWAAPKKKKKAPVAPAPVEEPAPAPAAEPAPEPAPELKPAPAEEAPPQPPPAPVVEQPPPAPPPPAPERGPPAVDAAASAGFGLRGLTQYSNAFATPLRVTLGFPVAALRLRFYPFRLMRLRALSGFELEGSYQVGSVVGALPLGAANANPADARLVAGYRLELGPVAIAPRFLYRTEVGGVERNALFDDPYYQSVGGELALALGAGGFFAELHGGGGKVLDTGTLSTKGYGKLTQGVMIEAGAEVGWRFGQSGLMLAGRYGFSFTRVAWAGFGAREFGPLTAVDLVHVGSLSLSLAR